MTRWRTNRRGSRRGSNRYGYAPGPRDYPPSHGGQTARAGKITIGGVSGSAQPREGGAASRISSKRVPAGPGNMRSDRRDRRMFSGEWIESSRNSLYTTRTASPDFTVPPRMTKA